MSNARQLLDDPEPPRFIPGLLCLLFLLLIGGVDYVIDYHISLLFFDVVPIGMAAIYVGPGFAFVLAVIGIAVARGGDLLAGMPYPGDFIFFSNCGIPLAFFIIVIATLTLLTHVRKGLETTVRQRNQALLQEMKERGRLEREVIELSEREHRRFGQELHDLVSQELAAIAIDAHFLTRTLLTAEHPESERARQIAWKVDRALTKARNIARGYFTLGFDAAGLAAALQEIAQRAQQTSGISCTVRCVDKLVIGNEDATVQLFRIAQEAVQNAVRHASASRIVLSMERRDDLFWLQVEDNGKGISSAQPRDSKLGLSIMAYRAGLIGGKLSFERPDGGGTRVICRVPAAKLTRLDGALPAGS
jgi:signal transduction histidine kinase